MKLVKPPYIEGLGARTGIGYSAFLSKLTPLTIAGTLQLPLPPLDPTAFGFPDPRTTPLDADGLLAVGGDLAPERLLAAYANGIFPWFNSDHDNILWWCPDPRGVLVPNNFQPKRSLRKTLRQASFDYRADSAFDEVIEACAATPRRGQHGTWITPNMRAAYSHLHKLGYAHSIEVWLEEQLVGGLYGVALGQMFFGESMFSTVTDASKCAFAALCGQLSTWNFRLLDCQMMNPHLESLGVSEMPRGTFLDLLNDNDLSSTLRGHWRLDPNLGDTLGLGPSHAQTTNRSNRHSSKAAC